MANNNMKTRHKRDEQEQEHKKLYEEHFYRKVNKKEKTIYKEQNKPE